MDIELINNEYKNKLGLYTQLNSEVEFILEKQVTESKIKISKIESRIKSKDSFINKAVINNYKHPFDEINDILGFRVITLFISDISKINKIVHDSFEVIHVDDKINTDTRNFGYLSVHIIAKLKKEFKGPRYDNIKDLVFEVQIRTITMNSWANISHYLDYKSDSDIPKDLKKDFYALSGLFYVADQHFELFFDRSMKKRDSIEKKFKKGGLTNLNQDINLLTLQNYLISKFPNRKHSDTGNLSKLVDELQEVGYTSIKEIDNAYSIGWDAFLAYEKDNPPSYPTDVKMYNDMGVIRGLLEIVDVNFQKYRKSMTRDLSKYRKLIKE